MRRFLGLFAVAVVVAAFAGGSQPVHSASLGADLSGTWTLPPAPGGSSEVLGTEGAITQDGSRLTLTGGHQPLSVYLDGRDSQNTTASGWTLVSQARWVTHALLITTKYNTPVGQWEDMVICSLDGKGKLNVVTVSAAKSSDEGMITRQFVYSKKSS